VATDERWQRTRVPDYEVSTRGRVRSFKRDQPHLLRPAPNSQGYLTVNLYLGFKGGAESHLVHALVLEAFGPPRPDGAQVEHIDTDPRNNRLENLRWATPGELAERRAERQTDGVGERNPAAKLCWADVLEIRGSKEPTRFLAKHYRVTGTTIRDIRSGKRWAGSPPEVERAG
jgi:hypothetical protein